MLHVFRSLCQDAWGMLELFINYDMATDRIDLFQKLLTTLTSIAQGTTSADFNASQRTPAETASVRVLAMEGVVTLMRSLAAIVDFAVAPTPSHGDGGDGDGGDDGGGVSGSAAGAAVAAALSGVAAADDATPEENVHSLSNDTSLSLVESYDQRVRVLALSAGAVHGSSWAVRGV